MRFLLNKIAIKLLFIFRSLVQFKNPTRDGLNICPTGEMMDFTSDVSYKDVNNFDASKSSPSNISVSVSIYLKF